MTLKNQLENQPIRMGAWDDLVCGLDIVKAIGWFGQVGASRLRHGVSCADPGKRIMF